MIACSRHRQWWRTSPRSQADVTVRPSPWLCVNLPACSSIRRLPGSNSFCSSSGVPEVVGKPAAFFLVHSPFWSRCGGLGVSQCCFRLFVFITFFVSAWRTRALARTDLDTHAHSSLAQDRSQKHNTLSFNDASHSGILANFGWVTKRPHTAQHAQTFFI